MVQVQVIIHLQMSAAPGAFKYYISVFLRGDLSKNADSADAVEGDGGSRPKC